MNTYLSFEIQSNLETFYMRTLGLIILCLTCMVMLHLTAYPQQVDNINHSGHTIQISFWKDSDGLPNWNIRDIIEDDRGILWMASSDGLASFDGRRFLKRKILVPKNIADALYRVAKDCNQNIWLFFQSQNGMEIYIYDPFQENTVPVKDYLGHSLSFSSEALEDIICLGNTIEILDHITGKGGCFGEDGAWRQSLDDQVTTDKHPFSRYLPAKSGNFWLLDYNRSEIRLITPLGKQIRRYSVENQGMFEYWIDAQGCLDIYLPMLTDSNESPSLYRVTEEKGIVEIPREVRCRLNWGNGINRKYERLLVRANNQKGIEVILSKNIVKVWNEGQLLDDELFSFVTSKYKTAIANRIFVLSDGSFWIVSTNGLIRINVVKNFFTTYLNDLLVPPSTRGLTVFKDKLYVNTYTGSYVIDLERKVHKPLHMGVAYGLGMAIRGKELWVAHGRRLVTVIDLVSDSRKQIAVDHSTDNFHGNAFFFFSADSVLLASEGGIYKYDPLLSAFKMCALNGARVYCFHSNKAGIWSGYDQGLVLLGAKGSPAQNFLLEPRGLYSSPRVFYIHEDSDGDFWLATDQGLWHWKPFSEHVEVFDDSNGLPNNRIHAVYEDRKGRLWLPTNKGLACFNKQTKEIKTYFVQNGLQTNEFNWLSHCRDNKGCLYFGSIAGVLSFHPDSIPISDPKRVKSYITSLLLYDISQEKFVNVTRQAQNLGEPIVLKPRMERMVVEFATPGFFGSNLIYKWRLIGVDTTWQIISEPHIDLFYLPYKSQALEIEAFDAGNSALPLDRLYIPLVVEKPYYLRGWFLGVMAGLLLLLILGGIRWRQYQLQSANKRLYEEVQFKTAELKEERDVIARQAEELKLADKKKVQFFQDVNHEIRTPLTLILGPVNDMLKNGHLEHAQVNKLQRVRYNANRILKLTEEIIELSRLESGVLKLEETVVQPGGFIVSICSEFQALAKQKNIRLQAHNELPETLLLFLDQRKVEKIINNLLSNAIKFTPKGGYVDLYASTSVEGALQIVVQDTGIGIAPEKIQRIFDRYYQVPQEGDLVATVGFGIGLAMSRGYTQLMGGTLSAESLLGKGTTMTVCIPVENFKMNTTIPFSAEPKLRVRNSDGLPGQQPEENALHVLVVENDDEIREYLCENLSAYYRVTGLSEGAQALAWLEQHQADLIISDLMMPGMSGWELLRMFRQKDRAGLVPFIIISARNDPKDLDKTLRLGGNAFLTKPFSEGDLLAEISKLFREKTMLAALHQGEASVDQVWPDFLKNAILGDIENPDLSMVDMALRMNLPVEVLQFKVESFTGMTFEAFLLEIRLQEARRLLEQQVFDSELEIAQFAGFASQQIFCNEFNKRFGKPPREFL